MAMRRIANPVYAGSNPVPKSRKSDREDYCVSLLRRWSATVRGFESHLFLHISVVHCNENRYYAKVKLQIALRGLRGLAKINQR